MKMRLAPAALGGFGLAIALILVFIYIAPQANQPSFYSGGSTATITSTTTATTTTTTSPILTSTSPTTSSTVSTSTVTRTMTTTVSTTTLSTTTSATTTATTTTAATTVTSTQPSQTTTLTSAVTVSNGLPTEIAYTTAGIAVIAIIIAAIVVTRRNLASATQLATTTTATAAASGTGVHPQPALKIGYEVDPEFMGEVKEEGKIVGYWISLPRGTSRDTKVTLKLTGAQSQIIIPKLLSPPKGVSGAFNPPSITLEEPKSETVTLTLEISSDTQSGVYILSITAGPSTEKIYIIVE